MNRRIYLFTFDSSSPAMDGAEDHLMLAYVAAECLFGRKFIKEEAYFWLDRAKGLVAIDADNGVNEFAAAVFSKMLNYMIEPEGYEVREALEPYRFDNVGNALKPSEKEPPQVIEVDREHPWLHALSIGHPNCLENYKNFPEGKRLPEMRKICILPSFSPLEGSCWYVDRLVSQRKAAEKLRRMKRESARSGRKNA